MTLSQTFSLLPLGQWKWTHFHLCGSDLLPRSTCLAMHVYWPLGQASSSPVLSCAWLQQSAPQQLEPLTQSPVRFSFCLTAWSTVPALHMVPVLSHHSSRWHFCLLHWFCSRHVLQFTLRHADTSYCVWLAHFWLFASLQGFSPFLPTLLQQKKRKLLHLLSNTSSYVMEILNANVCHNLPANIQTSYYINR